MNMLKRYTHLRAWQLVSKLDARRRQTQKWQHGLCSRILPISRPSMKKGQKAHRIEIGDFDNLHVTATTKEEAFTAPVRFCCVHSLLQHRKANVSHLPERYLLTT